MPLSKACIKKLNSAKNLNEVFSKEFKDEVKQVFGQEAIIEQKNGNFKFKHHGIICKNILNNATDNDCINTKFMKMLSRQVVKEADEKRGSHDNNIQGGGDSSLGNIFNFLSNPSRSQNMSDNDTPLEKAFSSVKTPGQNW